MNAESSPEAHQRPSPLSQLASGAAKNWPLVLGFLVLALPTMLGLSREVWNREIGAHGPIVLATGIWLITQCMSDLKRQATPALGWVVGLGLLVALPLYTFGRAYDFISIEAFGLYLVMLILAYRFFGLRALWLNFFPFLYLGFMVPPPGWLIDEVTAPLREFVSMVATGGLEMLGYPITRQGITIFIAQYQLLVEDACSGMNSLVGLTAVTLFYIYVMHRASWRYALFLTLLIIPIAVFVNILRVVTLILLTYYAGNAVAQGFLHVTAGIVLFVVALAGTFALDAAFQKYFDYRRAKRSKAA